MSMGEAQPVPTPETVVSDYRARRRREEEQALTRLIDAMRATSSPAAIERFLIARLAATLSEWNAAEAVHAMMDALRHRPADRPLDGLRNETTAAMCLALFCSHFKLSPPRDGWRDGLLGEPFVRKADR